MISQLESNKDTVVIVPAFNESQKISATLQDLKKYFSNIIVVDDGSTDDTFEIAKQLDVTSLRHLINLGQGAALQTGITNALAYAKFEFFVTFDADGQHAAQSASDMVKVARARNVDLVLGSRFLKNTHTGMPKKKKFILKLAIIFTRLDTGLKVTDTHNGLRVFNRKFASSLAIQKFGMAHASEILSHTKKIGANWMEFPADVTYSEYSIKKGQSIFNAVNILTEMINK